MDSVTRAGITLWLMGTPRDSARTDRILTQQSRATHGLLGERKTTFSFLC